MDSVVAVAADDQGLTMARGHAQGPVGLGGPIPGVEVLQTPNVVHFDICRRLTEFTAAGHEPVDEFCRAPPPDFREYVF